MASNTDDENKTPTVEEVIAALRMRPAAQTPAPKLLPDDLLEGQEFPDITKSLIAAAANGDALAREALARLAAEQEEAARQAMAAPGRITPPAAPARMQPSQMTALDEAAQQMRPVPMPPAVPAAPAAAAQPHPTDNKILREDAKTSRDAAEAAQLATLEGATPAPTAILTPAQLAQLGRAVGDTALAGIAGPLAGPIALGIDAGIAAGNALANRRPPTPAEQAAPEASTAPVMPSTLPPLVGWDTVIMPNTVGTFAAVVPHPSNQDPALPPGHDQQLYIAAPAAPVPAPDTTQTASQPKPDKPQTPPRDPKAPLAKGPGVADVQRALGMRRTDDTIMPGGETEKRLKQAVPDEAQREAIYGQLNKGEKLNEAALKAIKEAHEKAAAAPATPTPAQGGGSGGQGAARPPAQGAAPAAGTDKHKDKAYVTHLQELLKGEGLYTLKVDGIYGPGTERARNAALEGYKARSGNANATEQDLIKDLEQRHAQRRQVGEPVDPKKYPNYATPGEPDSRNHGAPYVPPPLPTPPARQPVEHGFGGSGGRGSEGGR